jgi:hypothetical protein
VKVVNKAGRVTNSKIIAVSANGETKRSVTLLPNPVKNKAKLVISASGNENVTLSMFDPSGRIIRFRNIKLTDGTSVIELDHMEQLTKGVYFVKVAFQQEEHIVKLILTK